MGIKQVVADDLTGEVLPDDTKPVSITIGKDKYDVYLSDDSLAKLVSMATGDKPLLDAKQQATISRRGRRTTVSNAREVRDWARSNGMEVPAKGRIPANIQEAFDAK